MELNPLFYKIGPVEHAYPEMLRKHQKRIWPNKFKKCTLAFRLYLLGFVRSPWGLHERRHCLKTNLRIPAVQFFHFPNPVF